MADGGRLGAAHLLAGTALVATTLLVGSSLGMTFRASRANDIRASNASTAWLTALLRRMLLLLSVGG